MAGSADTLFMPIENGEVPSADPAVKLAAQRTQRSTPMRDRAEKVGLVVKPTPEGLREAVASRFLAADDRRGAAHNRGGEFDH